MNGNEDYIEDDFIEDDQQQFAGADETQTPAAPAEPMVPLSQMMALMQQNAAPAPQQQQQAPPQMTDAERRAHLRQLEVDDTLVNGFIQAFTPGENGVDPANVKRVLEALVTGVRAEHLRAVELGTEGVRTEVGQHLGEVQSYVTEQKREKVWTGFATQYPQLTNFRQLVDAKATQLGPMMPPGTTQQQAFAYVANAVAADLQQMGIPLGKAAATPQQRRAAPNQFQNNQTFPGLPAAPTMGSLPMGLGVGNAPPQRRANNNPYFDEETFGRKK